tara:strand:+ start:139 stop:336 length:198 start_codon:yes stop_codon:yes gene_type:complete
MQIGDLVDDGFGCYGVIVELGWIFPSSGKKQRAYKVHFPSDPAQNGWYSDDDLKLISRTLEETCK